VTKSQYLFGTSFAEGEVRPLRVGRRLWIGPAGVPAPEEAAILPVWLGAGPAFGSGGHPTTHLCLKVLDRHLKPGARVLDLGTGTGILAIAAAKLGSPAVLALDIDPDAVAVAHENVLLNQVEDQVQAEVGTLARAFEDGSTFSLIVTNILAHVIAEFFEQGLPQLLGPGGWLVLSGFLRGQTPTTRAAIDAAGLALLAQEQEGEWTCIIAERRGGS
jgi:ribosomal protein L11 methyltransferase